MFSEQINKQVTYICSENNPTMCKCKTFNTEIKSNSFNDCGQQCKPWESAGWADKNAD